MERILDRLWLGSTQDAQSPLRSLGFAGVLDLRDGRSQLADESVSVFRLKNRDGDPWTSDEINNALDFVAAKVRSGKVLILCAAAMSRSVSMTIGYLVRMGMDESTAFEMVRAVRPSIRPVQAMLNSVLKAVRS